MKISIRAFGQLTDIVDTREIHLEGSADTDGLMVALKRLYPSLAAKKFIMAIDKKNVTGNTVLREGSTVALLPPFSGG